MPRHRYVLKLAERPAAPQLQTPGLLRIAAPPDREALAQLMLDAYRGTIDSDGETIDDARSEVRSFFDARSGAALLEASWVCDTDAGLAGACLISLWEGAPLIAYIMTAAEHKGRGLAGALLARSLASLAEQAYPLARAFVTEGNTPSERLLERAGFAREP